MQGRPQDHTIAISTSKLLIPQFFYSYLKTLNSLKGAIFAVFPSRKTMCDAALQCSCDARQPRTGSGPSPSYSPKGGAGIDRMMGNREEQPVSNHQTPSCQIQMTSHFQLKAKCIETQKNVFLHSGESSWDDS